MNIGPFQLHVSEATTKRIMIILRNEREITAENVRNALTEIAFEDAARLNRCNTPK